MIQYITVAIAIFAAIGWAMYFRLFLRERKLKKAPRVSDMAVKVSLLIFRDFTRLMQEARKHAEQVYAERYGEAASVMLETQLTVLKVESCAASNKHPESSVAWSMEYNPDGCSYITIFGSDDENLKFEIYSFLGHMLRNDLWRLDFHIAVV